MSIAFAVPSSCALAGLSSGFLPPPSGPSGWGQSSERGQEPAKPGDAFGDQLQLFPPVSRLRERAGFEGFQYFQFELCQESPCVMCGWLRFGYPVDPKLWVNVGIPLCTPQREQLVHCSVLVVAVMRMHDCALWVRFTGMCMESCFTAVFLLQRKWLPCPGKKLEISLVTLHIGVWGIWQVSVSLG